LNDTEHLRFYQRDKEVLKRWIEMSAFSDAVFRTHPSNNPAFNAQIWDDQEIAEFFKTFAHIFIALGEYKMELMEEMEQTGLPITRSLMLEFNDTDLDIDDQFMLGPSVMVAPILERGKDSRDVFFPQGNW
jgi:alpha-glucosidase (family GH31 glycosyl hydrolase)